MVSRKSDGMSVSAPSAPTYVQIETSAGSIELELYADRAPRTVYNFVELSKLGYYDGTTFHRVIEHFMLQGGDPTGSGLGGESIFGEKYGPGRFNGEYGALLSSRLSGQTFVILCILLQRLFTC